MEPHIILNYGITFLFTIIAVVIYIKMWKYATNELKTAPKFSKMQVFMQYVSALVFSLMVSVSAVLILALISQSISVNSLIVLDVFNPPNMWSPKIIAAFQFPNYLPITLIIITSFAFLYPLGEYILLARSSQEGPTNIQRWMETKLINRTTPPFSYMVALLLFCFIVLLAPTITSYIALTSWDVPSNISTKWTVGLIFFVWLMLGPIFYLSYYATSGISQAYLRGRRINLKKEKKIAFFYFVAILIIISNVWAFVQYLPILVGNFPNPTEKFGESIENQRFFIETLVKIIRFFNPDVENATIIDIRIFFGIVPLDFWAFIITTAGFGLLGFYLKFLKKEPLNSPKMVLFAAYIFIGIAFTIFTNAMIKWPWIFPDRNLPLIGLNLDLSRPDDREIVIRLFSTVILVEKTLNVIFLTNFIFFNKEMKNNADEWVLNKAILENDFETITKYKNHSNPNMRKLVGESVIRFVTLKDKLPEKTSRYITQILEELLIDEDPSVSDLIKKNQKNIVLKLDYNSLRQTIDHLLTSKDKINIEQAISIIKNLAKKDIRKVSALYEDLNLEKLSNKGRKELLILLAKLDQENHGYIKNIVIFSLDEGDYLRVISALKIIKLSLSNFKKDIRELSPYLKKLLNSQDLKILTFSLEVFSDLATIEKKYIAIVMREFNNIVKTDYQIIQQKIGAIIKFIMVEPDWFNQLFNYLEIFLKQKDPRILADASIGLGSLSTNIDISEFFKRIYPYLNKLVHHPDEMVRKSIIASLVIISQVRKDIYLEERFQHLFSPLMVDLSVEIRHQIYRFFIEGDPKYLLNDIAALLTSPLSIPIRIDLLNILVKIMPSIYPYINEIGLVEIIKKKSKTKINKIEEFDLKKLQDDKSQLFGFSTAIKEMSHSDATISLLYEIVYYIPEEYKSLEGYIENLTESSGDLSLAKKIEFYCKISLDQIKKNKELIENIDFTTTLKLIEKNVFICEELTQNTIINFILKFYKVKPEFHKKYLQIIYALIQQKYNPTFDTKIKILTTLVAIITDYPDIYFEKMNIKDLTQLKQINLNPFNDILRPYLMKSMNSKEEKIQKVVSSSLFKILEATQRENMIRNMLVTAIGTSKEENTKISAMKALVELPINIEEKSTRSILLKNISSKNDRIKAQAINAMGKIIRIFPSLPSKGDWKQKRTVKSLIYRTLLKPYSPKNSVLIKEAIVKHLSTIALIQPELPICTTIVEKLSLDPNPYIATKAVGIFFQYIDLYPEKIDDLMVNFRHIANSSLQAVNQMIIEKLISLHKIGIELKGLQPSLEKLIISSPEHMRSRIFDVFYKIYLKDSSQYKFFLDILLRLSTHRNENIRRDTCSALINFFINHPKNIENLTVLSIIKTLHRFSHDKNNEVKLEISLNLAKIIMKFPSQLNNLIQIVYILIRGSGKEDLIIQNTIIAIKKISNKFPEINKDMINKLNKFYKKSQDPILYTAIKDLKEKL